MCCNVFVTGEWQGFFDHFGGLRRSKPAQFDQSVILLCVRWYLAYNLSLRDLEEMAGRGTTTHRLVAGALQPA